MADGYQLDPAVLRRFAQVVGEQAQRLDGIHRALADVRIEGDAFGRLPASGDLHREYIAHAQAEVDDSGEAGPLLRETGDGLARTADNYERTEQYVTGLHRAVLRGLSGGEHE
ncbi:hypothetical protein KGA66_14310 [Actinocrinis puniceicyclus]|uniref:Uncharacterized protein n=1 Tax=Actinocrinis puniceicyclus TaxID=977794 RepID=A0A8J7WQI8_9ACTN|nr:hypothetical protein [Actinocrinis puniceicyclus]MBS2964229.1 hypothetical protein [Actinocrinis puniceicyclus]